MACHAHQHNQVMCSVYLVKVLPKFGRHECSHPLLDMCAVSVEENLRQLQEDCGRLQNLVRKEIPQRREEAK